MTAPEPGSALFSDAMTLEDAGEGVYLGVLNKHWTIGPKLHGGVLLSLIAAAARAALGGSMEPVAVSANFLGAPDPGPMTLQTSVRKRGRTVSVVDVELASAQRTADERLREERQAADERLREERQAADERLREERQAAVHAVVTLGTYDAPVPPLLSVNPVLELMSREPPPDVAPIGPGHQMADIVNFAAGCDIRPLLATVPDGDGRPPVIQYWVRPRGVAPDVLFALLCGDISVPVAFAVGRRGWAPTVQLTAYLRGVPADGWLRVICTTTEIGHGWFDSDHLVVDSRDRVVVQSRQLALVPKR